MRTIIDKPMSVSHISVLDKMITELSPYMNEYEVDKCIEQLYILENSINDSNMTATDSRTLLSLTLGSQRFQELCEKWNEKNQKFLTSFGKLKYKCKKTGAYYDGLDDDDDATMFEKVYI